MKKKESDFQIVYSPISQDQLDAISDKCLKALMEYSDKKMEAFFKEQKAREIKFRTDQMNHMTIVEKYLEGFNKLLKRLK